MCYFCFDIVKNNKKNGTAVECECVCVGVLMCVVEARRGVAWRAGRGRSQTTQSVCVYVCRVGRPYGNKLLDYLQPWSI